MPPMGIYAAMPCRLALGHFVFWHSVSLAAIVGVIVLIYAYGVPQWIPHGLNVVR
jgi:hypothetical protein